jgi:drug/metabolite transporter (DMT)-like permease
VSSSDLSGRGSLLVNMAVALFGLAGVLGDLTGLPAPLVVLGRASFAALALLALSRLQCRSLRVRRADMPLVLGQGVLLAVHWTIFFQSIAVSSVAIGLLSFSTFPLFTALLEPTILGTSPSRVQMVAALCILAGMYVLIPSVDLGSAATQGVLWGLFSASTFALLTVLNRKIGQQYGSHLISLYQNGIAAITLLPVLLFTSPAPLLNSQVLLLLLVLGVLCTAVAHTLFIAGLQQMTAQLASLLVSLESVWGIVFGVLLLGQVPTSRTLLGGAIIVGATMLPVALSRRPRSALTS